jgi:hypothetical protein
MKSIASSIALVICLMLCVRGIVASVSDIYSTTKDIRAKNEEILFLDKITNSRCEAASKAVAKENQWKVVEGHCLVVSRGQWMKLEQSDIDRALGQRGF